MTKITHQELDDSLSNEIKNNGDYNSLKNKPNLSTVATSGSYNDLNDKPVIPSPVTLNNTVTSTSTTEAATANAVKTAYDKALEAFQSANDGKTVVANAVTAKGVSASPSDTFATLANKIGQIPTGKKWATGSISGSNNFSITGLSFTPTVIILTSTNSTTDVKAMSIIGMKSGFDYNGTPAFGTIGFLNTTYSRSFERLMNTISSYAYIIFKTNSIEFGNLDKSPVSGTLNMTGVNLNWIAYE